MRDKQARQQSPTRDPSSGDTSRTLMTCSRAVAASTRCLRPWLRPRTHCASTHPPTAKELGRRARVCSFGCTRIQSEKNKNSQEVKRLTHPRRSPRCCRTLPGPSGTASARRRSRSQRTRRPCRARRRCESRRPRRDLARSGHAGAQVLQPSRLLPLFHAGNTKTSRVSGKLQHTHFAGQRPIALTADCSRVVEADVRACSSCRSSARRVSSSLA